MWYIPSCILCSEHYVADVFLLMLWLLSEWCEICIRSAVVIKSGCLITLACLFVYFIYLFIYSSIHISDQKIKTFNIHISAVWTKWLTQKAEQIDQINRSGIFKGYNVDSVRHI